MPSVALLACGLFVVGCAWALRRHQVPWAGLSLIVGVLALMVSGAWRHIQELRNWFWVDVVILFLIASQLVTATLAAAHYRQLSATYDRHFGAHG